jgi:predicted nucleic acid-binding protein
MPEEITDVVSRLYENFLMRDLTYVFGGSLLLGSVKYVYDGNVINGIDYVSENFIKFIIFTGFSYCIGYIAYALCAKRILNIFKTVPEVPEPYKHIDLLMMYIEKNYGTEIIRRIERKSYIQRFGAAVGSASFISFLIILVQFLRKPIIDNLIIFLVIGGITIVCYFQNKSAYKRHSEILYELAKKNVNERKLKLYLENSVINMYFQDDAPYLRDLTQQFWKEVLPHFAVYISEIVLDEIRATTEPNLRRELENLIKDFKVLEITEDVVKLSDVYLSHRRLPRGDTLHLASASIGEMDFLITWNLRHLYKRGTQEMIREMNAKLRIPVPTIVTPDDFLGEEEV